MQSSSHISEALISHMHCTNTPCGFSVASDVAGVVELAAAGSDTDANGAAAASAGCPPEETVAPC